MNFHLVSSQWKSANQLIHPWMFLSTDVEFSRSTWCRVVHPFFFVSFPFHLPNKAALSHVEPVWTLLSFFEGTPLPPALYFHEVVLTLRASRCLIAPVTCIFFAYESPVHLAYLLKNTARCLYNMPGHIWNGSRSHILSFALLTHLDYSEPALMPVSEISELSIRCWDSCDPTCSNAGFILLFRLRIGNVSLFSLQS